MRIPRNAKVEKAASTDQARPVLTQLYLRVTERDGERVGTLEATDSYMLARVPVVLDETDTAGFVPPAMLVQARKQQKSGDVVVQANGDIRIGDGAIYPRPDVGTFPSTDQLWPAETTEFKFAVNAKTLYALAQALGGDVVTVTFTANTADKTPNALRPLVVTGREGDGIIMPVRVD